MKVLFDHRNRFPLISEINMIPLIDVSLVLLIIFMVVTPFLVSSQIKINLPKAVSGLSPDEVPVKIQISSRKNFYIDGQMVLPDDLSSLLRSKFAREKKSVVLIEADRSVPFEFVVRAMDSAKLQGAKKLGVAVMTSDE